MERERERGRGERERRRERAKGKLALWSLLGPLHGAMAHTPTLWLIMVLMVVVVIQIMMRIRKDPEQHSIQNDIAAVMMMGVLIVTLINDVDDAIVD